MEVDIPALLRMLSGDQRTNQPTDGHEGSLRSYNSNTLRIHKWINIIKISCISILHLYNYKSSTTKDNQPIIYLLSTALLAPKMVFIDFSGYGLKATFSVEREREREQQFDDRKRLFCSQMTIYSWFCVFHPLRLLIRKCSPPLPLLLPSPSSLYIYICVCVLRVYTQGLQESRSDNLCECVCEERERERMEPV